MFALRPRLIRTVFVVLALCSAAFAQRPDPLPVDTGAAGLKQVLRQLQTTARLMHTTAHPDDEDGGMLTLEARGHGVEALLLTLTRGEGGQNKTGSNLFDELGVLRTLELLESDRYYGVEQRFTRLADFGYSKNAEESFQQWHGHEVGLADMVRAIRTFRPDVLVSRFQGASRDGHGHHEAAGILTREAFRAAADPNRFPEQIREGLQPWQVKKLYVDNVRAGEDYTVKLETTVTDPVLGTSYAAFAMQGLKHQLSQGAGQWNLPSGPRYATYKLVDSVLPPATDKDGHEPDFFAGIDTTLPGLAARVPPDAIPDLKASLTEIRQDVEKAVAAAEKSPYDAAEPLFLGLELTRKLIADVNASKLAAEKAELLDALSCKEAQFRHALTLALSIRLQAITFTPGSWPVVAPSVSGQASAVMRNDGPETITLRRAILRFRGLPDQVPFSLNATLPPASEYRVAEFNYSAPAGANYTRPQFRRDDPETQTTYEQEPGMDPTLPFPPAPVRMQLEYSWRGHIASLGSALEGAAGPLRGTVLSLDPNVRRAPIAIVPGISLLISPTTMASRAGVNPPFGITVEVTSFDARNSVASVSLQLPNGWKATPATSEVRFSTTQQPQRATFTVSPDALTEQRYTIRAVAESGGKSYSEGFSIVTREDLGVFYYYQPAIQKISAVNVNLPEHLKIGYVMGAGDDIPAALRQLGLSVHLITPDELAKGDLAQFDTIVLGIRAYETRDDLKQNNKRLLEYVHNGGTLLVQYTAAVQDFNSGGFTPYPAQLGRERVSVEQAPVQILAPADPVFRYPNPITVRDFDGWIQERGLYFMHEWDKAYEPLLASSDPGEAPLRGGLLVAPYGQGTYVYTGYAFFRQIPVGVPGAVRLFVNLLAAGHDGSASQPSNQSPRP